MQDEEHAVKQTVPTLIDGIQFLGNSYERADIVYV